MHVNALHPWDLSPRGAASLQREVVCSMVRTRQGARSVYVSVGHRISLASAERWLVGRATKSRLPEPARLADRAAAGASRRMLAAAIALIQSCPETVP